MRYLLVAITVVSILACVPYSDNPLTDPSEQSIDPSILGTWFWKDKDETGYIHIGIDKESKLLRLIMLDFDKDGELEVSEFSGHTSSLEENKYLNLKWVRPADEPAGYMFVRYNVNQELLGISMINTDAAEKAIDHGSLNGEVKKGEWSSAIHITEAQKKLQQFILRNDRALFPETKYLKKLKAPDNTIE